MHFWRLVDASYNANYTINMTAPFYRSGFSSIYRGNYKAVPVL